MEWNEILPVVAAVIGGLLVIAGAIVKLTPSTKDDEVVDKISGVVKPFIDSVESKDESSK